MKLDRTLEAIHQQLENFDDPSDNTAHPLKNKKGSEVLRSTIGDKVFIVHGHNETIKYKIASFVKGLQLPATILDEQANKGQTIIDKFEEHAEDAGFAIVLLTYDDVGAPKHKKEELKPRARQNVILELGYFLRGLGRERVCVLYEKGVELPSDIHGVIYVPIDDADGWKLRLAKEMQVAGLPIDMNKL